MWKLIFLLTILINLFIIVSAGNATDVKGEKNDTNDAQAASNVTSESGKGNESDTSSTDSANTPKIVIKEVINIISKKCAVHEKYESCPENRCRPQTCKDVGFHQCTSHEEKYYYGKEEIYHFIGHEVVCGPPACICIDNYVRNEEGVCIPTILCPSCGNDKNATSGCGTNCGRRCSNYNKKSVECAEECYVNSCDCKDDYVLDDYTGFCVLPEDCSNKDAPEPEGPHGTTKNNSKSSSDDKSNDDPCGNCGEKNCDEQETCENFIEYKHCSDKDNKTSTTDSTTTTEESTTPTNIPNPTTTKKPHTTTKKQTSWLEYIKNKLTSKKHEKQHTTKSPEYCEGKNELYGCEPCPEMSCAEYLHGNRCPVKTKHSKKCEPKCRCQPGYYRDLEENCVSAWDCRRLMRSTTTAMVSSTTTKNPEGRTTTVKPTTPEPNCEDEALQLFIKGNFAFTINILQELSLSRPGTNVMCAGASVLALLSKLALFAKGHARKQILNAMNLEETEQMCRCPGQSYLDYLLMSVFKENIVLEEIRCLFPKLIANVTTELRYVEYKFYADIYADELCQLSDDFKTTIENLYDSVPENIDFNSPESARQISETVAQNTNNNIQNFITTEALSALENSLILIDAQSFKGQLAKPFDPAFTVDRDFYSNGKVFKIPLMNQRGKFLYTDSLFGAKIVTLQFKKGNLSEDNKLVIVLPISKNGHKDLIKRMKNPDVLISALDKQRLVNVDLYLPQINITVANKLKMPVEKAKIDLIFNNKSSGLEDIADCEAPVVSEILQKFDLEIESGDLDWEPEEEKEQTIIQHTYLFKADHPFYYFVFSNKIMLFAGLYVR